MALYDIKYEIIDYDKLEERFKQILNKKNKFVCQKHKPLGYTSCGFPINHYSIGNGDIHVLYFAGVHGNEIIGVDFVTQLMHNLSLGKGIFKDFNPDIYTVDFIPLLNPEGIYITTYALKQILGNKDKEIFCNKYYQNYKKDANFSSNTNISLLKGHQKLFQSVTLDCLPLKDAKHRKLKEKVIKLYQDNNFPLCTLANFYSNANGVNLNDNNPFYYHEFKDKLLKEKIIYAKGRENNIIKSLPGPIGMPNYDMDKPFRYEKENKILRHFFKNHQSVNYASINCHGTGGLLYTTPITNKTPQLLFINSCLSKTYLNKIAEVYHKYSSEDGYKEMPPLSHITGVGDILRNEYKAAFLLELSKMGGNPLGPYGDKNNISLTMISNMEACMSLLMKIKEIKNLY